MGRRHMTDPGATSPRDHVIAGLWGLSEATFFFFVPDIWLTKIALTDPKQALKALGPALGGAVLGGALTYRWAEGRTPAQTREALLAIPAINSAMIDKVEDALEASVPRAMILGPAKGRPFKLYARTAGHMGVGLGRFKALSVPARLPRFTLVTLGAIGLRELALRKAPHLVAYKNAIHAGAWTAFYAAYFSRVGRTETGTGGSRRPRGQ